MMRATMPSRRTISSVALSLAALACAAAIVQACTAFSAAVEPAAEAGLDAPSTTTGDSGLATSTGDGGFCLEHADAEVCSDFDGVNPFDGWTRVTTDGGTLVTDETVSLSPPRSLRSTMVSNTTNTIARLTHAISPSAKRVRLSFEYKRGAGGLASMEQISIAEVFCANAGGADGVWVFLESPTFDVIVHYFSAFGAETTMTIPPLVANDWTHIIVDARLEGKSPTVDITVGAASARQFPLSPSCLTDPTFELVVGHSTYSPGVSAEGFFDNVLYEVNPP
jgi:hypothetical protein